MTTTLLHTRHKDGTLKDFPTPQSISVLAPFSALIISLVLIILFLIRYYILEAFLIPSLYGRIYSDLSDLNRRGFINHHIAGVTKIVILVVASYPFISVTFAEGSFHTPYVEGSVVTLGDLLVVVAQMLIGMYAFELIYRVRLSPVAVMHHIGTIVIGQVAIAISLRLDREPDADYEFVLCTVWGGLEHTISYHHPIYKLVRVGVMEECRSDVVVLRGDEEDLGCCSRSASDNDNTSWDGGGGTGR